MLGEAAGPEIVVVESVAGDVVTVLRGKVRVSPLGV